MLNHLPLVTKYASVIALQCLDHACLGYLQQVSDVYL